MLSDCLKFVRWGHVRVLLRKFYHARTALRPPECTCAQYSAASFIETINTNSLSMDADEFIARMVTAGVPDMQLMPQLAAQRSTAAPPAAAALPDPNPAPTDEHAGATPSALSEAESGLAGAAALPDGAAEPPAALTPDPALAGDAAAGGAAVAAAPAAAGGRVRGAAGAQDAVGGALPPATHPPVPALPRPQVCAGARSLKTSRSCVTPMHLQSGNLWRQLHVCCMKTQLVVSRQALRPGDVDGTARASAPVERQL